MSLFPLILGLAIFFAAHVFTICRGARADARNRLGEGAYKGGYSLVSAVGRGLIIWGFGYYRSQGYIPVWSPPRFLSHIALLLMLPAMILLVATYLPGKIKQKAKHPMLAAVKLWALAHLLANGDLGSLLLFGSFLAYGVYDRIAVKKRALAEVTPALGPGKPANDIAAIVIGTTVYAAFVFWLHPILIGVSVIVRQ